MSDTHTRTFTWGSMTTYYGADNTPVAFEDKYNDGTSKIIANDTFGEITRDELAALRSAAHTCNRCGMLADVDPVMHATRYGHAPEYTDASGTFKWSSRTHSWYQV